MRHWPPTFGAPIFKLVSSFSLLAVGCALLLAVDYQALDERLSTIGDAKEAARILRSADGDVDPALRESIDDLGDDPSITDVDNVKWLVAQRAMRQGVIGEPGGLGENAKKIKSNPLFKDDERQQSNWLGNAFDRLKNLFRQKPKPPEPTRLPSWGGVSGSWISAVVWVILGVAIAAFAYFALRHVRFKKGLKRRRTAVLEEHEPDRTLDEWLAQADLLASQGRYREAVRALYLACLLKFDERRIARFIRAETNWEHLARINGSPAKPATLDFAPPTQAFDLVWYGHRVEGEQDVSRFRVWYTDVKNALEARA